MSQPSTVAPMSTLMLSRTSAQPREIALPMSMIAPRRRYSGAIVAGVSICCSALLDAPASTQPVHRPSHLRPASPTPPSLDAPRSSAPTATRCNSQVSRPLDPHARHPRRDGEDIRLTRSEIHLHADLEQSRVQDLR